MSGDPRSNTHGTRTAADLAFNRSLREIITTVGNEEVINTEAEKRTRVELAVRGLYEKAAKGDVAAFNALVERVEGKVPQINELTGKDGEPIPMAIQFVPYARTDTDNS